MELQHKIPRKKLGKGRLALRITAIVLGLVLVLLLVTPFIVVYAATTGHIDYGRYEHPLQKVYTAADFGLNSGEHYLTTEDGYTIWTAETPVDAPKAVILYLTGIRQPSVTYYYGHAQWIQKNGYASFLLEVRGHGKSQGDQVCLGYEEVKDVRAVVDYIHAQEIYKDVPIVLQGVSMGGAIAVNAFGLYDDIDGLIAASVYSSFEDTVCDVMKHYHIPAFISEMEKPLVRVALRLTFGDKVDTLKPLEQVKNIGQRPAFFISTVGDPEVPPSNMERLLQNAPAHYLSWLRDEEDVGHFILKNHEFKNVELDTAYCERILAFLEENFAR